jgi:hypothetical protein
VSSSVKPSPKPVSISKRYVPPETSVAGMI